MLQQDVTLAIGSGVDQPTTATDCMEHGNRAEHCLNQLKEKRRRMYTYRRKPGDQGRNRNNDIRNNDLQGNLQ